MSYAFHCIGGMALADHGSSRTCSRSQNKRPQERFQKSQKLQPWNAISAVIYPIWEAAWWLQAVASIIIGESQAVLFRSNETRCGATNIHINVAARNTCTHPSE